MKKFFYLIPMVLVFLAFVPQIHGEEELNECEEYLLNNPFSGDLANWPKTFLVKMLKSAGAAVAEMDLDVNWQSSPSLAGLLGGTPGKNMYIEIYYKTQAATYDEAIRFTANETGFSELEVKQIIEGALTPVFRLKKNMEHTQALEIADEVKTVYKREKSMLDFRQEMFDGIAPTEIFSNGDLGDSGFDLIIDLNIIEKILFGGEGAVGIVGGEGEGEGKGRDKDESEDEGEDESEDEGEDEDEDEDESEGESRDEFKTPRGKESETGEGLDPASCLNEEDLGEAIGAYEKQKREAMIKGEGEGEDKDSGKDKETDKDEKKETDESEEEEIPPAEPSDWSEPSLCNDLFCIEVSFLNESASSYKVEENCVACHIEHIRDTLKETMSYTLVPGKVTGNIFEPPVCKRYAVGGPDSIDLQFYLIGNPVPTPSNDEAIFKHGSFAEKWNKYIASKGLTVTDIFGFKPEVKPDNIVTSTAGEIAKKAANEAPEGTAISEINAVIQIAIAQEQAKLEAAMREFEAVSKASDQAVYFSTLEYEINQMIAFFESYQKMFEDINTEICPKWEEMEDCK